LILIIFGEEYTLWCSSLCSFLHSPVTSSFFGPNILLSTLFSDTLSVCQSPSFTPIQNHMQNYSFAYSTSYVFIQQMWRPKVLDLTVQAVTEFSLWN
jgi:hypothetical protein